MKMSLTGPWLRADLGGPRRVLSFAPYRPGFVTARAILWREVRDADLTRDIDAITWLDGQMQAAGQADGVGMLTSRQVSRFVTAAVGPVACAVTVGLGNAERVGHRQPAPPGGFGTINIAVLVEAGLTDTAMIEALTIAAEARTAAVIDAGLRLPQGVATGTGTDCIALAADPGEARFAGLHTDLGEALGRAVHDAVARGAGDWMAEQAPS